MADELTQDVWGASLAPKRREAKEHKLSHPTKRKGDVHKKGSDRQKRGGSAGKGGRGGSGADTKPGKGYADVIRELAHELAVNSFRPAFQEIADQADQLKRTRPSIDAAYAAYDQQLQGQAQQQQQLSQGSQQAVQAAGGAMAANQAQLGQQQAQQAAQANDLYGQSMKAAEVAMQTQGAASGQLAQQTQNSGAFLAALGQIQNAQTQGFRAIGGQEKLNAHAAVGQKEFDLAKEKRRTKIERGIKEGDIASALFKEDRDFELAIKTLNQKDKESLRRFRLDKAALLTRQQEFNATNAREERLADNTIEDTERDNDREDAKAKEARRHNITVEQLERIEGSGKTIGADGKVPYHAGKKGVIRVAPGQYADAKDMRNKMAAWAEAAKSGDPKDLGRLKPWQRRLGKILADPNLKIPRDLHARIKASYPGGNIPRDIAVRM